MEFTRSSSSAAPEIVLDIRVTDRPVEEQSTEVVRSDYLTCKTDSTCDGSKAC